MSEPHAEAPAADSPSVGPHKYHFEAPDLFLTEMNGDLTVQQQSELYDLARDYSARLGKRIFWISDVRNAGRMSAEARKLAANANLALFLRDTVLFGASLHVRVIMNLLMKAANILQSHRRIVHIHCTATEAEARAYVNERRGAEE